MNIGLIGAENSHAKHFCEVINGQKKHDGLLITAVYGGDDIKTAEALCEEYRLTRYETEDEVIALTDAVVITYRKGSEHYNAAMKAINAGKNLFLDKPFTACIDETAEIIAKAEEKGILLTGGSSIKSLTGLSEPMAAIRPGSTVVISYAADPDSIYDGFWFYGSHTVELCIKLCGEDFTSVTAFRNGKMVAVNVCYPDKHCIIITSPDSRDLKITVTNDGKTQYFPIKNDYQSVCPDEFAVMLKTKTIPRGFSHYQKATELAAGIVKCLN